MSEQRTLPGMTSAISSPGSGAGPSPCGGPDSKALPESGPAPVRVSRFRALASDRATPTSATFGPLFTASSPSADLQRCLASRLRALMDVNGSPEFALTWKDWDMPAGEPICALRASERRTGGKGCSGWPTPMAGAKATADYNEAGNTDSGRRTVELCGWPTPRTPTGGPETAERKQELGRTESGGGDLAGVAQLAAWPTCSARDWKDTPGMSETGVNPDGTERKRLDMLPRVAQLAAWPTPNTMEGGQTSRGGKRKGEALMGGLVGWATPKVADGRGNPYDPTENRRSEIRKQLPHGPASTSSPAGTGKRGVLRPGHSRWLMGYPAAWDSCGATAMQSCRKSRRSS